MLTSTCQRGDCCNLKTLNVVIYTNITKLESLFGETRQSQELFLQTGKTLLRWVVQLWAISLYIFSTQKVSSVTIAIEPRGRSRGKNIVNT